MADFQPTYLSCMLMYDTCVLAKLMERLMKYWLRGMKQKVFTVKRA